MRCAIQEQQMTNITTGKTVFVFAGGGSFGAIQVGMKRPFLAVAI